MSDRVSILVTGGTGMIGSAVVREISGRGVRVVAVDDNSRGRTRVSSPLVETVSADVSTDDIIALLDQWRPDAIVHAAAHPGGLSLREPVRDVEVNAVGSMRVFDWCARRGAGVVFLSSSVVYGDTDREPLAEDAPTRPGTVYGACKLACEQFLSTLGNGYGLRYATLRLFSTYGSGHRPGADQGIVNIILSQLADGDRVVVKGALNRRRDLLFVTDAATAIAETVLAIPAGGKTINVGTGVATTIGELIEACADALGRPRSGVRIVEEAGTVGDPFSNVADITQARALLGFSPRVPLREGLRRVIRARGTTAP